jgi:hypothetical protein
MRETKAAMRPHVRADLEHDLIPVAQRQRARVATAAEAVHVDPDRPLEAEQPGRPERPAPDGEERREPGRRSEADDSARVERPDGRPATGGDDSAGALSSSANADAGRYHDDSPVREELEMDARAAVDRGGRAGRVHRGARAVFRARSDRRRHRCQHVAHASALAAVLVLAGCGGGGTKSVTVQPARQYALATHVIGKPTASRSATVVYSIKQPDGTTLTRFRRGAGPHTGVHVIYVRSDLGAIVHHHPAISANGTITDHVDFPTGGRYRVVVDVYPQQTTPQPNFQLFTTMAVAGARPTAELPPPTTSEVVDGYRFTMHGHPRLRAIEAAFLSFTVDRRDGSPAQFTPWFGALAHAIFFREGTLDYFHTHVCGPGATGCTSALGGVRVTGRSITPGKLTVGVLVPVAGTWRLFLQCKVDGHILTAPFTLRVR